MEDVLGKSVAGEGKMSPDLYNAFGAMHGTIMVFLGVVPLGFAAFGNYLVPLQIGAPDMTFPRINMASFWLSSSGRADHVRQLLHPRVRRRAVGPPTPRWRR